SIIDGFDVEARARSIGELAALFDSDPDSVVDLLIDRRPIVRASAIEALGRSSNKALDGFLLLALADPSAAVAVRAARSLARREDAVKLLRDDSAGWNGLQVERVLRAMAVMDERARNQIILELTSDSRSRSKRPVVPPPPPPPEATGPPNKKPNAPPAPRAKLPNGVAIVAPAGVVSVDGYNDEAVVLGMFPDLEAIAPVLPVTKLIDSSGVRASKLALTLALDSRVSLPADLLIKLLSAGDGEVARLAAKNLAVSGSSADIGRIEAFSKGVFTVSGLKPGDAGYRRPLPEELTATIKKIRWREQFTGATTQSARDELIKLGFGDADLFGFAWSYIRDLVEGPDPKQSKPIVSVRSSTDPAAQPKAAIVSPLAENLFPDHVTWYTAIRDAQGLIDKFGDSLRSVQLESPQNQANVLLILRSIEAQFAKNLHARPDSGVLESSGIKPHAPIVVARWTADAAPHGLAAAQRTAAVIRITDRDRFENFIATFQREFARFESAPEFLSIGARMVSMLPTLVPMIAGAVEERTPPTSQFTTKYTVIASNKCNGYPVTVIERREVGYGEPLHRDTVYIVYLGDAAVLATDWYGLRDCLTRLDGKGQTLGSSPEFKRTSALDGDVVYMSDLISLFAAGKPRATGGVQIFEQGSLKISKTGWESSFDVSFNARDWMKPMPFRPIDLKAPSTLLPRSAVGYVFARVDFAPFWRFFGHELFNAETVKQLESIWAVDLQKEVLPELGPECGAVLLGLPSLKNGSFDAPWAVFVQLKTDKLASAFSQGKLLKGIDKASKAAKIKLGEKDFFVAIKNGFLIIAPNIVSIERLDSAERLEAARDFERAARNVPGEVIVFGGANIEAAVAGLKSDSADPVTAQAVNSLAALARAFHSQSFYATISETGVKARMSVSMDREGRYSVSELAALSSDYQYAGAEIEARGLPIADQQRIDSLVVKLTSKAQGAIDRLKSDVSSAAQTADKRSDNELVLTVRPRRPAVAKKVELPVKLPEMADFLKSGRGIGPEEPEVIRQAREIAGDDKDAWSVARKLADWTFKNLKWKVVDNADASKTLATREADCLEFSQLFVSMARSLGLPSRIVTGLAYSGSSFGGHAWVEVWIGDWFELDPTWGTNFVDATHIRSKAFELEAYAALNLVGIEVIDARRTVPDFQKDPTRLVKALADPSDGTSIENVLSVAIDPAILIEAAMGPGTWSTLSAQERDQVYSAHRRLLTELNQILDNRTSFIRTRVLKVNQTGERAEALLLGAQFISVRLVLKNEAWFVEEIRYEDTPYNVLSDTMRPTVLVLLAKRNGTKPPRILESAESRILVAGQRDLNAAIQIADEALKERPNDPILLCLKARLLMNSSKEADDEAQREAVRIFTELSNLKPPFAPALRELADFYTDTEEDDKDAEAKLDKALDAFQRLAEAVPEDPRPHRERAAIFESRSDYVHAEAEYRAAIDRDPREAPSYSSLAEALVSQRRYKEALAALDQGRERSGTEQDLFAGLFWIGVGDHDAVERVEAFAAAASDRMTKSFGANLNLARLRISDNRPAEALPLLKRAAELDPKAAEPHTAMAEVHRKLHNWAPALKSADIAIGLDAKNAEAHFHRACALAQVKRRVEALSALRKAVELDEELDFTDDLEAEPDLKPLADMPGFKKLVKEIKQSDPENTAPKKKDDK
ncbi:MAG TPA: transglutaminase domain-containing protein, partial [Blastocatellia bacterium]|nr:transglutaminase domain-containing protein [Blastocatellia bacterium]